MRRNTSIILTDHFSNFVEDQLSQGRYGSTSEVIRAGLRLLEERETRLARLRRALAEGEESGPATPLNVREIIADAKEEARLRPDGA